MEPNTDPQGAIKLLDADIATLDLNGAALMLAFKNRWSLQRIDAADLGYRLWWQRIRQAPQLAHAPPDEDVEAFAHAHRDACSLRYEADCRRIFNRVLHHYGLAGLMDAADRALQLQRVETSRRLNAVLIEHHRAQAA